MIMDQHMATRGGLPSPGVLIDKANHLVQTLATPSLVQLVLRVALAVPFWRSGMLKWNGFLRLNDTAVTLFSNEFMLHLPGGPYHFPAPTAMAFLSGSAEIMFPILLVLGLGAVRSARAIVHDADRGAHGAGWLADPPHLGRHGAGHHGSRAGAHLARSSDLSRAIDGAIARPFTSRSSRCRPRGSAR
ncbi:hypothetical protein ABIF91_005297 [Bradyrhizobium sp. USDA 241]